MQGEASKEESSHIDSAGKSDARCCSKNIPQPGGTFPLNTTSSEAYSSRLFESYVGFKRRAASYILDEECQSRPWSNTVLPREEALPNDLEDARSPRLTESTPEVTTERYQQLHPDDTKVHHHDITLRQVAFTQSRESNACIVISKHWLSFFTFKN